MVAIITGNGTGLERSSAWVLGSRGQLGSAAFGRSADALYVNAATGNLVITGQDEFLIGKGPDSSIGRAYNSQGNLSDDNADNWKPTPTKKVWSTGTINQAGSTVTRRDWDGSETVFTYDAALGKYVSKEGAGAYDTMVHNGQWHWIDGNTRIDEWYASDKGNQIKTRTDQDGNKLTYGYDVANKLVTVTTESGESTELVYSGNNLTELRTTSPGMSTRVRYGYDGLNRLSSVTVDLSPADNSVADGYSYVTSYTYDGDSKRVASISQTDGSYINFTYVQVGADYKVASYVQTVAAGVYRGAFFDYSLPDRTTVTDMAGQKTILFYNGNKELTQISYPADTAYSTPKVVRFGYNGNGDVTSATLGPGNVITYEYDDDGNLTLERDSAGNTIKRTYSDKNELLTETKYAVPDPDGSGDPDVPLTTRYAYDTEGHLRYVVSAEGYVTKFDYYAAGEQASWREYAANAYSLAGLAPDAPISRESLDTWHNGTADKSATRYSETEYDFRGNVTRVTGWSKLQSSGAFDYSGEYTQTNYVHDAQGKLLSRHFTGVSGSEVFTYDGLGRQLTATDFGGAVTRTTFLDARGQTVLTHANGLSEISTYNRAGELISFSRSTAGGNLVDTSNWPGHPGNVPSGQATLPGWLNPSHMVDETQWASTMGPDGLQVVAMQAGQLDASSEGGGNYTNEIAIDGGKAYEFTYYFKLSDRGKHNVYFGISGTSPATVENLAGTDNTNPYFVALSTTDQNNYLVSDRWYKVVGYVLPQGAADPGVPLGGVYDTTTGQLVWNATTFRWNAERPGNTVHSRFFDYYGESNLQYSTYFLAPEVRQVSTATVLGPDAATSLYRYDSRGRLRMTVDPTGRRNYMMYDHVGRKVADIDGDGSVIEYRYDGSDNLTSTTRYVNKINVVHLVDAFGNPTEGSFNELRPAAHADDQWTFQVYDAAQRLIQTIDGSGATSAFSYDGASRLTSTRQFANKLDAGTLAALKAEAGAPNLWSYADNGLLWSQSNLSVSATGTSMDGAPAFQFSVVNSAQWEGFCGGGQISNAGDTISFTISIKGVGSVTSEDLGIWGNANWGANADGGAFIVSGPGALTRLDGSLYRITGLSTTQATRVTITRRLEQTTGYAGYLYVNHCSWPVITAGDAAIAAAPVFTRTRATAAVLPTTSASDRITRNFHDKDGRVVAALDGAGGLVQFVYDKAGRKIQEFASANPASSSLWATGTLGQLQASVGSNPADRKTDYVYDARGFLRYTLNSAAQPTRLQLDNAGRAVRTVAYAASITPAATYSFAYVEAQIAAHGLNSLAANRISRTVYDAAGRVAFSIDAVGAVAAFAYDAVGNVVKQTRYAVAYATAEDPSLSAMQSWATGQAGNTSNRVSRNVYDQFGRIAYTVDAESYVSEVQHDRAGRVTKEIRYAGAYAVSDGVTKASLAAQIGALPASAVVVSHSYDADGRRTETVDGTGAVTRYVYDSLGQLTDTTIAYGTADASTLRRVYDAVGRVVSETAAYGTGAAGTTGYAYDALGNVAAITDARGNITTRTYDTGGRVLTVTVPLDSNPLNNLVTSYGYDAFGNLGMVTDARGNSTFTYYDALGRMILQSDNEEYITATSYTPFGEIYQVTRCALRGSGPRSITVKPTVNQSAADATTTFTYDKMGRLTSVTDAMGHTESYGVDAFGDRYSKTNKAGGVTAYAYDRLGRLAWDWVPVPVHRPDGTVQATGFHQNAFWYDSRGNVTAKAESYYETERRNTYFAYDKGNRLIQVTHDQVQVVAADLSTVSNVTPTETYTYNMRGDLIQSVDAGGGKTLSYYDARGRKTAEVSPVGMLSTWVYDGNGNVLGARVYSDAVAIPGSPGGTPPAPAAGGTYRETGFGYDPANRLYTTSVAGLRLGGWNGSTYSTYVDAVGTNRVFDKAGNVVAEYDGVGYAVRSFYDRLGRKVAQVDRDDFLTVWSLDSNGNSVTETRYAYRVASAPALTATVAELIALVGGGAPSLDRTTSFTYDKNGHRTSATRANVVAWTVSGLALSAAPTNATVTYTFNPLGLVESKTEANGDVTWFEYDNQGRLKLVKEAAYTNYTGASVTPTTETVYDGLGNVVRNELNKLGGAAADDRVTTYTYGAGGRLASATDAEGFTRHYGYDAAGRVVKESWTRVRSDGSTVTEAIGYRYDAAGRVITQVGATWNGSSFAFGDATRIRYNTFGETTGRGITAGPNDTAVYQETFDFDAAGRLWRSTEGDGVAKLYVHDRNGAVTLTIASSGTNLGADSIDQALNRLTNNGAHTVGAAAVSGVTATIQVYNRRGEMVESREPFRQLSSNGTGGFNMATIVTSRTHNAFGEATSETDARGYVTDYSYNAMGRLILKQSPSVNWTSETGAVASARPTETYYYDLSGRLVGIRDANNNLTTRTLVQGTGHDGGEALVYNEYHADGGVARSLYNDFREAYLVRDELGQDEYRYYDKMGRIWAVAQRGVLLTDYYAYDGFGRRIRHYNTQLTASATERTDYDINGRVVYQTDFSGAATTTQYYWNTAISTYGLGDSDGWTKTTTLASGQSSVEHIDYFGRMTNRNDFGGHTHYYEYNQAGWLAWHTTNQAQSQGHSYLNTGRVWQIADQHSGANSLNATYSYDAAGNRILEAYIGWVMSYNYPSGTSGAGATLQNATITYDALNRVTSFTDWIPGGPARVTVTNEYDLNGNVRRTNSVFPDLANPQLGNVTQDKWYRYDSMNRTVTADGVLSDGTIVRGAHGVDISYDVAGRRRTQTRDATLIGIAHAWVPDGPPQYQEPLEVGEGDPPPGHYEPTTFAYDGIRREEYEYRADGALSTVKFAETGYTDNYDGTVTSTGVIAAAQLRAQFDRDAMGRVTRHREWDHWSIARDRTITYDLQNHIDDESVSQRKSTGFGLNMVHNTYVTETNNTYVNGLLVSTANRELKNNIDEGPNGMPDSLTTYSYTWWDGPQILTTTFDGDTSTGANTVGVSTYYFDGVGRVASVDINDGRRRAVSFAYTPDGQTLLRKERSVATTNPEDQHLFLSGMQVGELTNNGNYDPAFEDYATNILKVRNLTAAQTSAPFRWNTTAGVTRGSFGTSAGYDYINPESDGANATGGSYIVRGGDTLQSIAAGVWGDASLWYLIASANGLSGAEQLIAGQSLFLPDRVTNIRNSASTFEVFDPNRALGDLAPTSPTAPKATKKGGKCGIMGTILLVVVAVAVTALTAGAGAALSGAASGIFSGMGAIAAGTTGLTAGTLAGIGAVAGAMGSIASQAVGVATGVQDKFSWKGVALGALSGAVSAGVGASGVFGGIKSAFLQGALRGAASSAITQGIAVATGLQGKFSWAGVAAAGIGSGVGASVGKALGAGPLSDLSARNIGANLATSAANSLANAAAHSLLTGTDFGDNIMAALPDVIGSTIGDMIAGAVGRRPAAGSWDYDGDGIVSGAEQSDSYATAVVAGKDAEYAAAVARKETEFAAMLANQGTAASAGSIKRNVVYLMAPGPAGLIGMQPLPVDLDALAADSAMRQRAQDFAGEMQPVIDSLPPDRVVVVPAESLPNPDPLPRAAASDGEGNIVVTGPRRAERAQRQPGRVIPLTAADVLNIKKTLQTEWVPSAGPDQARGIVDTILNRLASGHWGTTVSSVVNARNQFSDINGPPSRRHGRDSVEEFPASRVSKRVDDFVDYYLAERANGTPSSVGSHLNYANPHYSDARNLRWIMNLNGPVYGRGRAIHRHGTVPELRRYQPRPFTIELPRPPGR